MPLLSDLFGVGYTDPRLQSDSADANTADVLSQMPQPPQPTMLERFLATPEGQGIMIAVGLMGGRAGVKSSPAALRATVDAIKAQAARPRTAAEVGDQLPLPLGDTNRFPAFAPRAAGEPVPPTVLPRNMAAAEEAAAAIRQLGPEFEPVVMPKGNSVYLRVLKRDAASPDAPGADTGFKGRFADHAQMNWASISADPASANTAADVVRAFRHHAGIDKTPPEVGWSRLDRNGKKGAARQRGGIGVYEANFREQGRASPIRKTVRLFEGVGAAGATGLGAADDVTTEDVARLLKTLRGGQ